MRLSVIIPAFQEQANIRAAVESAWGLGPLEVLVVDGGSRDQTWRLAQAARARVLSSALGRATQQNAGAHAAQGEVLLFLHADCRPAAELGAQLRQALADTSVLWGAVRQRIEARGLAYRLLERGNAWRVRCCGLPYGDQAIFVRRQVFDQLGGFPEFPLLEDVCWGRLARRVAWPRLLPGPVYVSPRRWQRYGVVRQTVRNWAILAAHRLGVSPQRLAAWYRRHGD